jgi:hypothetical protein
MSKIVRMKPGIRQSTIVATPVVSFVDYYTTPNGKFDSGYYVPPSVKASMSGEIINYLREEQRLYIQFDSEFVLGRVGQQAVKSALSVECCCTLSFNPSNLNRMQFFHWIRVRIQERTSRHRGEQRF